MKVKVWGVMEGPISVEEVEDEAVEAVVATRSRWSSSRRRMHIYSYVYGEIHVW